MKKRVIVFAFLFMFVFSNVIYSQIYHSLFTTSLINSDGVSSSESVVVSPVGGEIEFSKLTSVSQQDEMFTGAIYDGEKIWLVPYSYDKILYYSKNGEQNQITLDNNVKKQYYGGAFDGKNIYLSPYECDTILQIDKETKQTHKISFEKGENKYKGAAFDGERVWFFPSTGNKMLSLDKLGEINYYTLPQNYPENAFSGGIIVNEVIYLLPDKYKNIVTYDISTDKFSEININTNNSFCMGASDGENIWMFSKDGSLALQINSSNSDIKEIKRTGNNETSEFCGGAYDGRFIWLAPQSGNYVLKYDTEYESFTSYALDENEGFSGGVFDGKNIWFAPYNAASPLIVSGNNTPPVVQNIFLNVNTGENISSELSANDKDEGDKVKFFSVSDPSMGNVDIDSESGVFTYQAGNMPGVDHFYFKANDMYDDSNIGEVTITISETTPVDAGVYFDMQGHWAKEAAEYFYNEGVIEGEKVDAYKYFYPEIPINRVRFIIWANAALGYEGDVNDNTLPFEDINGEEAWVVNAASAAYQNKLILGEERNEKLYFNPYKDLSRLEAFVIMYNVLKPSQAEDEILDFEDNDTFPAWSLDILKSLKNANVLKGYDDNTLRLFNNVSRAEAAQILYETINFEQKKTKNIERLK